MWEFLLSPIDPNRAHDVGIYLSWHARVMTLAWAVMSPTIILVARYFKVTSAQKWPSELDNAMWWRVHWIGQVFVILSGFVGLYLVILAPDNHAQAVVHRVTGYGILTLGILQILSGLFRGSKGGPTSPAKDGSLFGDHYNMTPHRLMFERIHKSLGYLALILVIVVTLTGLWWANALVWMWVTIIGYWGLLVAVSIYLQVNGRAIDTYQAIWGPSMDHPGNRTQKQGWAMTRPYETENERK